MRVAILHDYLNQFGGAERVLQTLLEIFPEADLYTLLYDKEKTRSIFEKNITKKSFLDIPIVRKRHRLFIPLMPLAARSLKSGNSYDLVISSSAGYAKGFGIKGKYHISYCHSPLRYAWEIAYLKSLPILPWLISHQLITRPIAELLKIWDKNAARKIDFFIANSNFIAEKIRKYYAREATVIFPPVNTDIFYPETKKPQNNYFLMVGRLLYYKRFDLGIRAFNELKYPLKIVGKGPEHKKLKLLSNSSRIEFLPEPDDRELRWLYANAKGLIFPQIEDFGLVAAEAQACGLPVLAYAGGGALEIVENGKTGLFFKEQTPEAIIDAIQKFEKIDFNRKYISKTAKRFSKEKFKDRIKEIVKHAQNSTV